jgi:hypothetical protein
LSDAIDDRDVPGLAGDRGLDALLVLAVAELDQRVVVEAHPRDVAGLGGAHQRAGRRTELATLGQRDQLVELRAEVEAGLRPGAAALQVGREQLT